MIDLYVLCSVGTEGNLTAWVTDHADNKIMLLSKNFIFLNIIANFKII